MMFLNFFAAAINYQVGKDFEVIFNLATGSICVIMLTLCLINSENNYVDDRSGTKKDPLGKQTPEAKEKETLK